MREIIGNQRDKTDVILNKTYIHPALLVSLSDLPFNPRVWVTHSATMVTSDDDTSWGMSLPYPRHYTNFMI